MTLTLPDAKDFQGDLRNYHKQLRAIVDINKFSKVLRNLVSNAIKFTPTQGKVTVHLELVKTNTLPTEWLEGNVESVWKYAKARSDIHRAVSEAGLQLFGYIKINVTDSGVGLSQVLFYLLIFLILFLILIFILIRKIKKDYFKKLFKFNQIKIKVDKVLVLVFIVSTVIVLNYYYYAYYI